jgi:hypothetical protein
MIDKNNNSKKFHWHASVSSEGTLDLSLYFPNKDVTKEEKEKAIASTLAQAKEFMLSRGYLLPDTRFMSSSDVAEEYGHTRQYWEKLLNEGKIPYKETSAGRITTNLWVQGYLNNKEKIDEYLRNRNKVVAVILKEKNRMGTVECPRCKEKRFDYAVNSDSIDGLCRAGCGFRIHTTN